jgi:hypothetical protein
MECEGCVQKYEVVGEVTEHNAGSRVKIPVQTHSNGCVFCVLILSLYQVRFANSWSAEGLHFIPYDKLINSLKNFAGKPRLILVYSQLGEPLAVYQGDSVYVTVPSDLPKMTRLNIDGHSLYLHRVNYTIIEMALMQ